MLTDSAVRSPAIPVLRAGGPKRNLAHDCLDARSHVLHRDLFDRLGFGRCMPLFWFYFLVTAAFTTKLAPIARCRGVRSGAKLT